MGRHPAAVELDEVTPDRQAQPEPAVRARRAAIALPEPLEYMRKECRRDAVARIGDIDANFASFRGHRDLHAPATRREFHGVRQQVPEDLLQAIVIGPYLRRRLSERC